MTITDPVAGTAVTIDHERQLATRLTAAALVGRRAGHRRAPASRGATDGVPPAAVSAVGGGRGHDGVDGQHGRRLQDGRAADGPGRASGQTTALEPQTIEGVQAEGTRTTVTIPAGAIGNELPIEIVSERWYSPELKMVVLSRRADPRFGETVYRLTNLVRGEPSADLFEIPAGYRVDEPKLPPLPR